MRVCLYTRISTDEDHQPTSLTTQRERLERYCQAMDDWHVTSAFEDQASGVTLNRPGLQQALELARERRFDLLLVYRVDRLSRKVRQLAALAEELDQLDIVLKSATEPFDTGSAAGRMMLQMLGVFAEFEHATIVDRVTAGLERRVREGKWMSGRTPYGYRREKESKLLVPDEVRAPVVKRIFQLYAEGKLGTTAIARKLEAEAALAPRKQGWSPNALQLILANPAYRGLIRWNDELHQGLHEPLVDQETFEHAQSILARRHEDASLRRGNPTHFLLSGLVRCGHCGRAYVGTSAHGNGGRYTYYHCSTRYKYGPSKCNGDRLPKDRLEEAVLTQLASIYRNGRLIEKALADAAERGEQDRPQLEEALAGCRADSARTERKLDRYYEAFESGELSAADCHERVRGHRARLETLREQEADLTRRLAAHADEPPDGAALTELADQLDDIIASESPEQAKELLRLLVKEIRVHNRRRILPIYRVPAAVRAIPRKVERTGIEPVTSGLQTRRVGPVRARRGLFKRFASAGHAPTSQLWRVTGCDGCDGGGSTHRHVTQHVAWRYWATSMPRRSNLFQDVVAIIHRHMAEGATVEESAMLLNRVTGELREVDVVIKTAAASHPLTISVEASSTSRRASVEWVERMIGKHDELPTDKLVLVSETGFVKQAEKLAEAKGVILLSPKDLAKGDPAHSVVNRLRSIWPKTVALTPERAKVFVRRNGHDVKWFKAPADLNIYLDDGTEVGQLIDVAGAVINGNFLAITEQIGLKDIAEDFSGWFTFRVGPGWKVTIDGQERGLTVRYQEGELVEYHPVDALEITGRAVIGVSEVSLTHKRLGDVTPYAYGEARIEGRPALIVITENAAGGKASIRFQEERSEAR